ncbi:MAG: TetR family transcriptional regulator [Thermoanaerobaculia bacterium]
MTPQGTELERSPLTTRGRQTQQRILGVALEMFRRRGYNDTTMREIARQAGVSLGNTYYYFRSKEHLIQGFYARSHQEHLAACQKPLEAESDFQKRLQIVLRTKIETSQQYHRFSGLLFRTAADPSSPLSPFSPESMPVRRQATDLFAKTLHGSQIRSPKNLAAELANLLWLYQMGIILYWIHDRSTDCAKTYRLIEVTSKIVTRLIQLAGNPLFRPLTKATLELMRDLRSDELQPDPLALNQ